MQLGARSRRILDQIRFRHRRGLHARGLAERFGGSVWLRIFDVHPLAIAQMADTRYAKLLGLDAGRIA